MAIAARRNRVAVPGSEKKPISGARSIGKVDPDEWMEVTIRVRRRSLSPRDRTRTDGRKPLTREQFRNLMGADPQDILAVERFAHDHGLNVVQSSVTQRSVRVAGTAAAMAAAFAVNLKSYRASRMKYRGRTGAVFVPKALGRIVEAVIGLDNRPQAKPHFRLLQRSSRV